MIQSMGKMSHVCCHANANFACKVALCTCININTVYVQVYVYLLWIGNQAGAKEMQMSVPLLIINNHYHNGLFPHYLFVYNNYSFAMRSL